MHVVLSDRNAVTVNLISVDINILRRKWMEKFSTNELSHKTLQIQSLPKKRW